MRELIRAALKARESSYCPYSAFAVGAALEGADGRVYTGCNIENAAYTPTNCAERTAFFKAVSQGVREFRRICIVGGPCGAPPRSLCAPCGVCRQVMQEFCPPDSFQVVLATDENHFQVFSLGELLPLGFGPDSLKE